MESPDSSYTLNLADTSAGLLVDRGDRRATRASFDRIGAAADFGAWNAFYSNTELVARALFPTMCEPLPTRSEAQRMVGDDAVWDALIETPLGGVITERFQNDLVRGVVATDALIGTFTSTDDASLDANRCFLYHVIGNETGDWDVPIGGMGAVTGELEKAARKAGGRIVTGAEVTSITPDGEVRYWDGDGDGYDERVVAGRHVLANVEPWVLPGLLGDSASNPVVVTKVYPRRRLDDERPLAGTDHPCRGSLRPGRHGRAPLRRHPISQVRPESARCRDLPRRRSLHHRAGRLRDGLEPRSLSPSGSSPPGAAPRSQSRSTSASTRKKTPRPRSPTPP